VDPGAVTGTSSRKVGRFSLTTRDPQEWTALQRSSEDKYPNRWQVSNSWSKGNYNKGSAAAQGASAVAPQAQATGVTATDNTTTRPGPGSAPRSAVTDNAAASTPTPAPPPSASAMGEGAGAGAGAGIPSARKGNYSKPPSNGAPQATDVMTADDGTKRLRGCLDCHAQVGGAD
jgi:hypothetical protein